MASPSSPLTTAAASRGSSSTVPTKPRLIDFKEVIRRTGLSSTTIKRLVRARTFPPRVKIGTATRWEADAVDRWIDDAIAAANEPGR